MKKKANSKRPFLGIYFECCRVYGRIYRNVSGSHYAGHCPRCMAAVRIRIQSGGNDQRIFRAR